MPSSLVKGTVYRVSRSIYVEVLDVADSNHTRTKYSQNEDGFAHISALTLTCARR